MEKKSLRYLFPIFFFALLLLTNTQLLAEKGFSSINNALFGSPHMKGIKTKGKLHYQFTKTSSDTTQKDDVIIDVTNIRDDSRTDQAYTFLTGKNHKPYIDRKNILGNGIFMLFLEWDIHDLERKTEGSWRYFQRRIRWAMAEDPVKKLIDIDFGEKKVKAVQYTIQPYAEDKKKSRYGKYINKYYIFTLSEEIPGTIYQIRTIVPTVKKWEKGDKVIADTSLTFASFTPSTTN